MAVFLELTETVPEHIVFNDDERALCKADCDGEETRYVPAERGPLADASIHICHDCTDEWARIKDEVKREPTVRCACDRAEDGHLWKCGEVVPASVARALRHPAADGLVPVCPGCYNWLRDHPQTAVETPFEDAPTWARLRCPRE